MRNYAITGACFLLITLSAELACAQGRSQPDDVGRYQLFQGQYRFINLKGEEHWLRALFKIDTKTGKLFICEGNQIDGKFEKKEGQLIQRQSCKPFEDEIVVPKQ